MADVERWAELRLREGPAGQGPLRRVLSFLEDGFGTGGPEIEEFISFSFLELLPRHGERNDRLRGIIGDSIRRQLDEIC